MEYLNADELGFMMRGILRLKNLNEDSKMEKLLMHAIKERKAEFKDAFALQGALLYLSNHSIDNDDGRKLLFSFLEHLETRSVIESMDKDVRIIFRLVLLMENISKALFGRRFRIQFPYCENT